jgi:hypothetical protein
MARQVEDVHDPFPYRLALERLLYGCGLDVGGLAAV